MTGADVTAFLKKHPIGAACGLVSIACGVILYLHSGDIENSQTDNAARSAEASKMIANVRNSANLSEQLAELQGQTKELESRLMRAGQLAVNLQYFYRLEAETEVKLLDVRQGGLNRNTKLQYGAVPFTLSVQGTFPQVVNFMNKLQTGRHFCRIGSVTFNKSGSDVGGPMTVALNIDILGQP